MNMRSGCRYAAACVTSMGLRITPEDGPSMMPGGSPAAWEHVKPIFQGICAKVEGGVPCWDWVGENGAGHFVKMVHIYYIPNQALGLWINREKFEG